MDGTVFIRTAFTAAVFTDAVHRIMIVRDQEKVSVLFERIAFSNDLECSGGILSENAAVVLGIEEVEHFFARIFCQQR